MAVLNAQFTLRRVTRGFLLLIPIFVLSACGDKYKSQIEAELACFDWQYDLEGVSCQHDPETRQHIGWENDRDDAKVLRRFYY